MPDAPVSRGERGYLALACIRKSHVCELFCDLESVCSSSHITWLHAYSENRLIGDCVRSSPISPCQTAPNSLGFERAGHKVIHAHTNQSTFELFQTVLFWIMRVVVCIKFCDSDVRSEVRIPSTFSLDTGSLWVGVWAWLNTLIPPERRPSNNYSW